MEAAQPRREGRAERHFRVVTYDPPGNGRSGRPASGYDLDRCAADARVVMDATGTPRASIVAKSRSAWTGVILAAEDPARVERLVLLAPALDERPRDSAEFYARRDRYDGWAKVNAHYWREHYADFSSSSTRRCSRSPALYRDVETDGARRAAALIAPLLEGGVRRRRHP